MKWIDMNSSEHRGSLTPGENSTVKPPFSDGFGLALFTDLYELTMAQAYIEEGMTGDAVFSLYVRTLPEKRKYLLAAGLNSVLEYLRNLRFTEEDLEYLEGTGFFNPSFLDWLRAFEFSGDVYAVPEGTPVFPGEPVLEVAAPLPQAQLVETLVLNQIHVQTLLASKASRIVTAASGRKVVDFGSRRTHGTDAALKAARSFYLAGVAATSNVLAGKIYGIPVSGTMAHSYVQAHENELDAFRAFARIYPETVLLVDTYDTINGVSGVISLARELGDDFKVRAIRLDSGDIAGLSIEARRMLDDAGLEGVEIFASGGLDEDRIAELLSAGARLDGFGVGTRMGVSSDAPDLDVVFKLCQYEGRGKVKLSEGKPILPGRKQVFRSFREGRACGDIIARNSEDLPGRPLLEPVMKEGTPLGPGLRSLDESREYAAREVAALPDSVSSLLPEEPSYPVEVSQELLSFQEEVSRKIESQADKHVRR